MQRSEPSDYPHDPGGMAIVGMDQWVLREMIFTPERSKWLWEQLQRYPSLSTDPTRGRPEQFLDLVLSPQTYWLEVWTGETLIGVLYMTHIQAGVDAKVHIVFFDRKLGEKAPICAMALRWAAWKFSLHRFSIEMPEIYFATSRLAKKLGFHLEGNRKEMYIISGRWVNELVFGLLASELTNG